MKFDLSKLQKYQAIPTRFLEETKMSLKAKGLLCHIYSLPNNWDYTMNGLAKITGTGIKQLRSTIEELEIFGYIVRKQTRELDGKINYDYIVNVNPLPFEKRQCLSVKSTIKMEEWRKKLK